MARVGSPSFLGDNMPREMFFLGIYFPPMLVGFGIAFTLALITAFFLNHFRLAQFFWHPPIVFISLVVIYWVTINRYLLIS